MEHFCVSTPYDLHIVKKAKGWTIYRWDSNKFSWSLHIHYCPFCGQNLKEYENEILLDKTE